ncbi:MAG: HAMP domain-containing histidine kinase [Planctomycetes bacterium]|nr:HAMP domain-containing histidine kinase [Planctomycetota bacterium]
MIRSKTTAVALLVGAVALALVTFGIVALESALHNAEAAAAAEARRAAFAAVRELRSRVLHPAFVDRLPAGEGFVLDGHSFRSPRALPQRTPVNELDFVTRATLDLARKHEFVDHDPAMALERVDEAILRGDRAAADLGVLLTTAMWICQRRGTSMTDRARAYRHRVKSFDSLPAEAIARTLLFDAAMIDRERTPLPVVPSIEIDTPPWAPIREVMQALVTRGDEDLVRDTIAGLRTYSTIEAITQYVETSLARIAFLRGAAELLAQEQPRLAAAGAVLVERVVLERPSRGDAGDADVASHRAVLLYYPHPARAGVRTSVPVAGGDESFGSPSRDASPIRRSSSTGATDRGMLIAPNAMGVAFVLPFERFETLALASGVDDGVPQPSPIGRLEPRMSSTIAPDVLPVFEGIVAIPVERTLTSTNQPSRVLFVALAVLLLAGLCLLVRSYRTERAALAARSDFLRSITHELRTPLASIRLFADTLAEGRAKDEAERTEFTQLLAVEAGRLSTLVENALELGRTERGERTLHFEVARIDELVQEGVALFEPLAREAGLSVQFSGVRAWAHVDRDALRQVLWNLLDNARKYAGRGCRVSVAVSVVGSSDDVVGVDGTDRVERTGLTDRTDFLDPKDPTYSTHPMDRTANTDWTIRADRVDPIDRTDQTDDTAGIASTASDGRPAGGTTGESCATGTAGIGDTAGTADPIESSDPNHMADHMGTSRVIRGPGRVVLRVCDDGPGIETVERARVFERFVRGAAQRDGSVPGAGLGLAIVRSIVTAHGGSVRCTTSSRGRGTCFEVALPACGDESALDGEVS